MPRTHWRSSLMPARAREHPRSILCSSCYGQQYYGWARSRTISAVCRSFLRREGSIVCQVTGSRRISTDLAQGGLEIPCVLTFIGPEKQILKVEKLMKAQSAVVTSVNDPPPGKKAKN